MIQTVKEKLLNKYPLPVTIAETEIILNQMKYSICKIENKNGNGTGFFCKLSHLNKKLLITNNHIINEEIKKENDIIRVTLNDNEIKINLKIKDFYTSKEYDTTIIEINNIDEHIKFLEIDNDIFDENIHLYYQNIYIIQYPKNGKEQKASVSYGILREMGNEANIMYNCSTDHGSSGSPIVKLSNQKIIGVHKEGIKIENFNYNIGTFLKYPINEYLNNNTTKLYLKNFIQQSKEKEYMKQQNQKKENMIQTHRENVNIIQSQETKENNKVIQKKNEIKLKVKIEEKDINKDIYFLDNFNQSEHCHDHLKELNELNTEIYINNTKYKYTKSFKPEKVGLTEIKIKFNIQIKDCSYMFYECSNLTSIDLSSFDTTYVNNMKYMFGKCHNLTSIDLSSFDTRNVTDMSFMFSFCSNLKKIDLSSFNTKNVTDMSGMFYYCFNLKKIDLSSFDTNNVTDMSNIFYYCSNLKIINLSSFETKKNTNINNMFSSCSKLNQVKINNISYNIINSLKNNDKNITIVDQFGNNIPNQSFNNTHRALNINYNINNFNSNNSNNQINNEMNDNSEDSVIDNIKNWWNNLVDN